MSEDARRDPAFLVLLDQLLNEYVDEVMKSELSQGSKEIYTDQATNFVRWANGDFHSAR